MVAKQISDTPVERRNRWSFSDDEQKQIARLVNAEAERVTGLALDGVEDGDEESALKAARWWRILAARFNSRLIPR